MRETVNSSWLGHVGGALLTCSIITPIEVYHAFNVEVYFSVFGENEYGEGINGPGGLRVMRLQRPVVLPSVSRRISHHSLYNIDPRIQCAVIPRVLYLPSCKSLEPQTRLPLIPIRSGRGLQDTRRPPRHDMLRMPPFHPAERHRLDEREGWTMIPGRGWSRPSGKPLPFGTPRWQACACGVGMDQMEERMRRSERSRIRGGGWRKRRELRDGIRFMHREGMVFSCMVMAI